MVRNKRSTRSHGYCIILPITKKNGVGDLNTIFALGGGNFY